MTINDNLKSYDLKSHPKVTQHCRREVHTKQANIYLFI